MLSTLAGILTPIIVLVIVVFLIFRLRLFTEKKDGRYAFLFGSLFVLAAAVWQAFKIHPDYLSWFIPTAYPVIDFVQFIALIIGLLLIVVGLSLYSDFWQTRLDNIKLREGKLSILDNLQHDARQPYQLMELLNISLKEILFHLSGCAGAIFLINRKRRQFILTSAVGLTKEETAYLEYYPLQGNIVSQAVDLGDPLITGEFEFVDRRGEPVSSRFQSGMVLPLISGIEKVGGILLFSEDNRYFSNADIRFLSPVADWLSEKIKTARLSRELTLSKSDIEKITADRDDFLARVLSSSKALNAADSVTAFCRALVGLSDSGSAHIIGLKNGLLVFYGGSEPLLDLSENYKTALINAINRKKPLIVNQESTDDEGRQRLVLSSLVYPMENGGNEAMLFRRDTLPFSIDDRGLKIINLFSHLARIVLNKSNIDRLAVTRLLGLDRILEFLKLDETGCEFEKDQGYFIRGLTDLLPDNSQALTFVRDNRGVYRVGDAYGVDTEEIKELQIQPGEGSLGRSVPDGSGRFIYGKNQVARELEAYAAENKNLFNRLFGERGVPVCLVYCPFIRVDTVIGGTMIFIFDMDESERSEWQRLLTLAAGLYSLRLTIDALQQQGIKQEVSGYEAGQFGTVINRLNNYLSVILGNAELVARQDDISGDIRAQLKSIIAEAEKAAGLIKKSFAQLPTRTESEKNATPSQESLGEIIEDLLKKFHISGNLYMAGGQPREINMAFNKVGELPFPRRDIEELFMGVLERFTGLVSGDDVISVAVYQMDKWVYLDISRHRKNFPPVERVARFGEYIKTAEAIRRHPSNDFLRLIRDDVSSVAFDRAADIPAYLSFKFPLKSGAAKTTSAALAAANAVRVLAIDDEAIILDLIAAMCQSMGYRVHTAASGQEGIELALKEKFDIVLTDLAMPDMNGYEVAARIRKVYPDIPIILVTGWEARIDSGRLASAGITRVLYKPFRIEQLTEIIQKSALSH
ncbi:MAG: response regulator [candidate division Zixibacteria bacterium]|nr:response regulator [candidate division Zixibacteria bacterium]